MNMGGIGVNQPQDADVVRFISTEDEGDTRHAAPSCRESGVAFPPSCAVALTRDGPRRWPEGTE